MKMNYSDRQKFDRLLSAYETNYRLTHLYAAYLENVPEMITPEMIEALTADGALDKKDAIVAILSEAFGLDYKSEEDRRLIRDYLPRSVTLLDAEKYRSDPYYQNVKIENVTEGEWELRWESYKPYRAVICEDMVFDGYTEFAPLGFFTKEFSFPAVLEGSNEWMTLTPVDMDTSREAIFAARGRVITFGLGLGYYAYMAARKSSVESVTVIEKSEKVIKLFNKYILPYFECGDKIRVICADAFEYAERVMPSENYDVAFVDTWRDASDGLPMYERMKPLEALSPKTEFHYWIERFILSRRRALLLEKMREAVESGSPDAPSSFAEAEKILFS